jgi:hypothetical protein
MFRRRFFVGATIGLNVPPTLLAIADEVSEVPVGPDNCCTAVEVRSWHYPDGPVRRRHDRRRGRRLRGHRQRGLRLDTRMSREVDATALSLAFMGVARSLPLSLGSTGLDCLLSRL